jgi:hypothetical protein
MSKATTKTVSSKSAPKRAKAAAAPKKTKAKNGDAKPKAATKIRTPTKPRKKAAKLETGIIRQTTGAISQLASDILADRIVPTIEQIKSIAASALAQDQAKGKRPKKK